VRQVPRPHRQDPSFEDANAWVALSEIFTNILQDSSWNSTYVIIDAQMRLSLELNTEHVSRAVEMFVDYKVSRLALIEHDSTLQEKVRS
jgi:hypothetical protein